MPKLKVGDHILTRINDGFAMDEHAIVEAVVVKGPIDHGYATEDPWYDLQYAGEKHTIETMIADDDEVTPEEMVKPWAKYGDDLRWCFAR